jgi:hypothetical protein
MQATNRHRTPPHRATGRAAWLAGAVTLGALTLGALTLGALMTMAGCADTTGEGVRAGKTRVYLTDAPFPYDSVARVDVYVVSIAASTSADTTPANRDWVTIAQPKRRFNLLDVQNGATALLGEGALPAGRYRSVRLVLDTDSSGVTGKAGYGASVNWQSSAGRPTLYALVERRRRLAAG